MNNAAIAILLLVMFTVGFLVGSYVATGIVIEKVTMVASHFIEVDEKMVSDAIFMYANNIGCMVKNPLTYNNASIRND